jgi:hypothetical protein
MDASAPDVGRNATRSPPNGIGCRTLQIKLTGRISTDPMIIEWSLAREKKVDFAPILITHKNFRHSCDLSPEALT